MNLLKVTLKKFSRKEKLLLFFYVMYRSFLNFLDVLAALLISILVIQLVGENRESGIIFSNAYLSKFQESSLILQSSLICAIYLIKPILAFPIIRYFNSTAYNFGTLRAKNLFQAIVNSDYLKLQKVQKSKIIYGLSTGIESLTSTYILTANVIVETLTLLILFTSIFIVEPVAFFIFSLYAFFITMLQNKLTNSKFINLSREYSDLSVQNNSDVADTILNLKEIRASGRTSYFVKKYYDKKFAISKSSARYETLNQVPRFLLEITMAFGILIISTSAFYGSNEFGSTGLMAFYFATLLRVIPTLGPIQGGINSIKNLSPRVETFSDLEELFGVSDKVGFPTRNRNVHNQRLGSPFVLEVKNLSVFMVEKNAKILDNFNFTFYSGKKYGLVGKSGSGKTTILNSLAGLYHFNKDGTFLLNKIPLHFVLESNPGILGYVSQETPIYSGSLIENIALGCEISQIDIKKVSQLINSVNLTEWFSKQNNDFNCRLTESGGNLSGGQRQKIGIARALYSSPKILLLDEITSSLDLDAEREIIDLINNLDADTLTIIATHREAPLEIVDEIIYL